MTDIQQYSWGSAHVLAPFIIGVVLIIAFFVWEMAFAPYPMVPRKLFSKTKRTMSLILVITFLSGANYFVLLLFWPTQVFNLYGESNIDCWTVGKTLTSHLQVGSLSRLVFAHYQ